MTTTTDNDNNDNGNNTTTMTTKTMTTGLEKGRKGRRRWAQQQGLRHRCVLSPWYVFFFYHFLFSTNNYLQVNDATMPMQIPPPSIRAPEAQEMCQRHVSWPLLPPSTSSRPHHHCLPPPLHQDPMNRNAHAKSPNGCDNEDRGSRCQQQGLQPIATSKKAQMTHLDTLFGP